MRNQSISYSFLFNKIRSIRWIFYGLVLQSFLSGTLVKGDGVPPLTVELTFAKTELLPLEPLLVRARVVNHSDKPVVIPAEWNEPPLIEFHDRSETKSPWLRFQFWWRPSVLRGPALGISVPAGGCQEAMFDIFTFDAGFIPLFRPGRTYDLRLVARGPKVNERETVLASQQISISVLSLASKERDAYQALVAGISPEDHLLPALSPELKVFGVRAAMVKAIQEYVTKFPTSIYSIYFRRTLYLLSLDKEVSASPTVEVVQSYREFLVARSLWALPKTVLHPKLRLSGRGLTSTAMLGIPVVVEFKVQNVSDATVKLKNLGEINFKNIECHWMTARGEFHRVEELDLSKVIPAKKPIVVEAVPLKLGEVRTWLRGIPTPPKMENAEKLTLLVSVPGEDGDDPMTTELNFEARETPDRCVLRRLGPDVPQAAVIDPSRVEVLTLLQKPDTIEKIRTCAQRGDPAAKLLLFSISLSQNKNVAEAWGGLEDAPEEARCVRSLLLLTATSDLKRLEATTRAAIREKINDKSPIAKEVAEALRDN